MDRYDGMCDPILVRNSISVLANGVSLLHSWTSFELDISFQKRMFFISIDNTITKALHKVVLKHKYFI